MDPDQMASGSTRFSKKDKSGLKVNVQKMVPLVEEIPLATQPQLYSEKSCSRICISLLSEMT